MALDVLAAGKVHLTPQEAHALWRLTQWLGYQFWHLTPWAQAAVAGVPGATGFAWLWRWDPLTDGRKK